MSQADHPSNSSRRSFLTSSVAGAAVAGAVAVTAGCAVPSSFNERPKSKLQYGPLSVDKPFDDLRSYIAALEERGLVLRIEKLDQDAYEMTALMYRLVEEHGWTRAPALLVEHIKINGQWVKGPVIANHQGHWHSEAITFGLDPVANDPRASYRKAIDYMSTKLDKGIYEPIDPVVVSAQQAPCKEVIITGDNIDLNQFAFIQSNPADGGRYIDTGSIFTEDPELGMNYGTYRCQIHGPRTISVNSEPNQSAWKHFMAAKERGEKSVPVSIVVGQDPYVWIVSGSRVVNRVLQKGKINELAVAGGIRGKALETIKSESNNLMIPAHAEIVIEGVVMLDHPALPEGPFGEMMGYMGPQKSDNFTMRVDTVTHRKNPWVLNVFTGVTRGYTVAPTAALYNKSFQKLVPQLIEIHSPLHAPGITYVRIKKTKAGQGLRAGKILSKIVPIYKLVMVFDEDVDILDQWQVDNAIAARWQPEDAYAIVQGRGMPLDPSLAGQGPDYPASKLVIDATRPLAAEGRTTEFAKRNRDWLNELAPDAISNVNKQYAELITGGNKW
ncbi:UbiD family decarboxylase [Oceanicoccus sp. KOV_DT_Chl]|uniref:UbiD family decarboxylase n=1 Tax=Oceanicoccus sp. KOV_DT_Chl TaxID=1904639 RepID=UPI000C7DBB07|nr:UbiD family decarboxylase [Oceanicoccus sp. KOV_DT_Chl]